ncbi:hypothetical protein FJ959_08800 [Mesorhizobium sp. B2-2-4]|uniref:DUF7940 domain-containing protein n=1 Tax=unclassified Mesorhizobium TaxID=325217 RepID=UPI00112C9C23|nr:MULTISPECIES: hypothetical protein [unclassified Mesorhizobium]TPM58962.1 hypothetical protein FJ959_08800 [Mesorhizobium sp. B2-2-4]TPM67447.1 hypothetical protein FJ965_09940 [Mesorhizobium sp. B2-2-1]
MRLIPEWRRVLCHAYSVHFVAVSLFFGALDVIANFWTLFDGLLPISRGWFAVLGTVFGIAGLIGRFIPQPKINGGSNADK